MPPDDPRAPVPADPAGDGGAARPEEDPRKAVIRSLAAQTEQIGSAPRRVPDLAEREREKAIVHECRYLMRLLAARRRSEGELRARLAQREVPWEVACEAIARTDRAGLIDDAAFAREWVAQRRELRSLSDEALRRELQDRSVAPEHIATALALDAEDEETRARELVRTRLERERRALAADPRGEAPKVARRLDALLRRKGYDGALALHVISTEMRAATGR